MIITYHGVEFFKLQFGDTIIALNPVSKESKFKNIRFGADMALYSLNDKDMNGIENVAHGDRSPFIVSGPGEYEIKGIFIKGAPSESGYGGEKRINTIYTINMEGMNLCFLGALDMKDLPEAAKEAIDDVDILFVPIGGEGVLNPADAYKLAVKLEPKIIIPMHYGQVGDKNALKIFLKEGGEENTKPADKLTIKKKELEGKEGEIIVLAEE